MKRLNGRTAAITGAASGIGRALAVALATEGCDLALSDINEEGLTRTAGLVEKTGLDVTTTVVDVADRDAVHAWADATVEYFGEVHMIFNNAGVSLAAAVDDMSYEDFEWLMDINFWGVVHGTKAFLPHIREAGEGHVVNISSIFGIVASPTQSAYNAAKFAVRGFTESLRAELEYEKSPIGCTVVHPGGVKTNIVEDARFGGTGAVGRSPEQIIAEFNDDLARITPGDAAAQILNAVKKDRGRVLVGLDAFLMEKVQRLLPSGYIKGVVSVMRRKYASES